MVSFVVWTRHRKEEDNVRLDGARRHETSRHARLSYPEETKEVVMHDFPAESIVTNAGQPEGKGVESASTDGTGRPHPSVEGEPKTETNHHLVNTSLSAHKPTGEWALKAIEKWKLQPPYDTAITEVQWQKYYETRLKIKVPGGADMYGARFKEIDEELVSENDRKSPVYKALLLARQELSVSIGNCNALPGNEGISKALKHSLYLLDFWGNGEGDGTARSLIIDARIYSPLGTGRFIDLHYHYHLRTRMYTMESFSNLKYVCGEIGDAATSICLADPEKNKGTDNVPVNVFNMRHVDKREYDKRVMITVPHLRLAEAHLFHSYGMISPLKIYKLLLTSAHVSFHNERNIAWAKRVGKRRYPQRGDEDSDSDNEVPSDTDSNVPMPRRRRRGDPDDMDDDEDDEDGEEFYDDDDDDDDDEGGGGGGGGRLGNAEAMRLLASFLNTAAQAPAHQ
ncbi:hypothetical protein BD410DRAFT_792880 [Rickenella mellea]|uniref:Uncharacterized protein n=1 Tax=Rickenella mellea TaxID=50990 RepID=A0A4Y7PUL8_9AGAM|nr:hypothetical protein BD410DRAFT_792880 [Rickenella mellea]